MFFSIGNRVLAFVVKILADNLPQRMDSSMSSRRDRDPLRCARTVREPSIRSQRAASCGARSGHSTSTQVAGSLRASRATRDSRARLAREPIQIEVHHCRARQRVMLEQRVRRRRHASRVAQPAQQRSHPCRLAGAELPAQPDEQAPAVRGVSQPAESAAKSISSASERKVEC